MDEELIPFIAFFLIIFGWVFYINRGDGKQQKFYKEGTKFKDDFGEYFEEDIKKLVKYVEDLPKVVKKFKGLNYRQQIIFKNKDISIINDSKSTSYSSSIEMLKRKNNIYWLLGGIPKIGDRFNLSQKNCRNIKGYIFGINQNKFSFDLKNKVKLKKFSNLSKALNELFKDIKKDNSSKKTILFSPAAASFDSFKNFEHRGKYFNKLIKKHIYA